MSDSVITPPLCLECGLPMHPGSRGGWECNTQHLRPEGEESNGIRSLDTRRQMMRQLWDLLLADPEDRKPA